MSEAYDRNFKHAQGSGDILREVDTDDSVSAAQRNLHHEGYSRLGTTSYGHAPPLIGIITPRLVDSARRYRAQPADWPELALAEKLTQISRSSGHPDPMERYSRRLEALHLGIRCIAGHSDALLPPWHPDNTRREYSQAEKYLYRTDEVKAEHTLKVAQTVFGMRGLIIDLNRFVKTVARSDSEQAEMLALLGDMQSRMDAAGLGSAISCSRQAAAQPSSRSGR